MQIGMTWYKRVISQDPLLFLDRLLDQFENNPFHSLEEMHEDWNPTYQPYNGQHIRQVMQENRQILIGARALSGELYCSIDQDPIDAVFMIFGMSVSDVLLGSIPTAQVVEYLRQTTHIIEKTMTFTVHAFPEIQSFYKHHNLPKSPFPLKQYLNWLVTFRTTIYLPYLTREDMLHAPAFAVYEEPDGAITYQVYEHPLDYGSHESQQRIIDMAHYLAAHAHEYTEYAPLPEQTDGKV